MACPMPNGSAALPGKSREGGFTYIALLVFLVVTLLGLDAVVEVWHVSAQRERENQLLFVGAQFRQAFTRYYQESPPGNLRFPSRLEDLLEDNRTAGKPRHHLRSLYVDPMTGKAEWGEVRLPSGQIVGVYSLSDERPLKKANFNQADKDLADKSRYSEWVFRSPLPAAQTAFNFANGYTTVSTSAPAPVSAASTPPSAQGAQVPVPRNSAPTPAGYIQPLPRAR